MRYLIIGADAAGLSAASQIRRRDKEGEIVILEMGKWVSYGLCGLPYYLSGEVKNIEDLLSVPKEKFEKTRNVQIKLFHKAISIDRGRKVVVAQKVDTGEKIEFPYDKLIITTGAEPIRPSSIKGIDLEGIYTLHSLDEGVMIRNELQSDAVKNVVLVGAGYVNLEVAEAVLKYGKKPLVVEMLDRILKNFDVDVSSQVKEYLEGKGIKFALSSAVEEFRGENGRVKSVIAGGKEYPADLVILSIGVKPRSELAKEAGLDLNPDGGIKVDCEMRTSDPDIFAAGDCVSLKNLLTGKPMFVPLVDIANKTGVVAGDVAAGGSFKFPGVLGTQSSELFDMIVTKTGLSEEEAKAEGFNIGSVLIKANNCAHYMPDHKPIWIKLVFEKPSGRILGSQAIGYERTERVNAIAAMAITQGMRIQDLLFVDFDYTPRLSPVWEPIQQACRVAMKQLM